MKLAVQDHYLRLRDAAWSKLTFAESPNQSAGFSPELILIHYTAGSTTAGAVSWLCNPQAGVSAHLVIGRDGEVVQLVPFNRRAWHAGASEYQGRRRCNGFAVGIELVNVGPLKVIDSDPVTWKSVWGALIKDPADVFHEDYKSPWQEYPEVQLQAALAACLALKAEYPIRDVVGHSDVAPGRKIDPGPAFPMRSFRDAVMGRADDDLTILYTTTNLNIRTGPGTEYDRKPQSPLPLGAPLFLQSWEPPWLQVVDASDGPPEFDGWVHGRYVTEFPQVKADG